MNNTDLKGEELFKTMEKIDMSINGKQLTVHQKVALEIFIKLFALTKSHDRAIYPNQPLLDALFGELSRVYELLVSNVEVYK